MNLEEYFNKLKALPQVMHLEIHGKRFQKHFRHTFNAPATQQAAMMELLNLDVFDSNLEHWFELINGCKLFHSDTENDETGKYLIPSISFFTVEQIAAQTAYMQATADMNEEVWEERPAYSGGLAFAEANETGNVFVYIKRREFAGKIIYNDTDSDWFQQPFADSFVDLLKQITEPPFQGLCNLCGADKIWFE